MGEIEDPQTVRYANDCFGLGVNSVRHARPPKVTVVCGRFWGEKFVEFSEAAELRPAP